MVAQASKLQFSLDLEPSLLGQYQSFREVVAAVVYGSRIGLSGVAAHCDLSPSALTRMLNLNPDDPRHLPMELLPKIIEATGDLKPIYWLIAKFIPDEKTRQRAVLAQLQQLMPAIQQALTSLGTDGKR